jgi:hypothetical protein
MKVLQWMNCVSRTLWEAAYTQFSFCMPSGKLLVHIILADTGGAY